MPGLCHICEYLFCIFLTHCIPIVCLTARKIQNTVLDIIITATSILAQYTLPGPSASTFLKLNISLLVGRAVQLVLQVQSALALYML